MMTLVRRVAIASALGATTGCGAGTRVAPPVQPAAAAARQSAVDQAELKYIAKARADSARYPYTKADIDFMTGMIAHHAQAIRMSVLAPTHGASPSIRTLCDGSSTRRPTRSG